ncbi:MAG: hypothetical protein ACRDGB_12235 [Candidatus Limnocylindria bacterium]
MLHGDTAAFLIRCGVWALLAWTVWSQPIVKKRAYEYRAAWVEAWKVDAGGCDVRAYGLLFRRACEE